MYKVIYQKSNGEIIERIRNTFPHYHIGQTTSMGWVLLDVMYYLNDNYYSHRDYQILMNKYRKRNKIKRNIRKYIKKYASLILYVPLLTLYFIK